MIVNKELKFLRNFTKKIWGCSDWGGQAGCDTEFKFKWGGGGGGWSGPVW